LEQVKPGTRPDESVKTNGESARKRWFYISVSSTGEITKGESDSPENFSHRLSNAGISWVDYVTEAGFGAEVSEMTSAGCQLGFSLDLVSSLASQKFTFYQDFDIEMGMKVPSIQVRGLDVEAYPLIILVRKNIILTIHPLNVDRRFTRLRRYAETFVKKIPVELPGQDKMTMLLTRIVDHNNDRNIEHLRQIEERGNELSDELTNYGGSATELTPKIHHMRRAIIVYLNALWDTVDVLHTLRNGDADLITDDPKLLDRIGLLTAEVNRQIELTEHLSEIIASEVEALQSIYNNQLQSINNRMAFVMTYLTIIGTAVLVPNTLATILGDPVFDFSTKDQVWYWPLMIIATTVSTILAYLWVKRQGLLGNDQTKNEKPRDKR
jgi:magnesium transporter